MNAGLTPIFSDIDRETFMLSPSAVEAAVTNRTKVLMPVHMWGNPEDMDMALGVAAAHGLLVVEDCALSLGARWKGKPVGSFGKAAVFSFGCLKPIQAGEGGLIATNDGALARELRALRGWGEMTAEFGIRDHRQLAWNGRVSEIVAAVILEQLRGYPRHLEALRESALVLGRHLSNRDGIEVVHGADQRRSSSWTQFVLRIDEVTLGQPKAELVHRLRERGVHVWHANFELIPSVSFFREGRWRPWVRDDQSERIARNYSAHYPNAARVFASTGLGIGMRHLLGRRSLRRVMVEIDAALLRRPGR
jgi:dTDP-4-amino-4,6-dideoxygalactose transaminase